MRSGNAYNRLIKSVNVQDSKSRDGDIMGVRFPLPVPVFMRVLVILYFLVCSAIRNLFSKNHFVLAHTLSDILGFKARPNPAVDIRPKADVTIRGSGDIIQ
ncbi:MAG: hypothetical protein NMNS01_29640 [Nitrosomonas sp.]|nr:MAG: hypothetical protein NMNS01_29640 [Nitrosomonas sp.]